MQIFHSIASLTILCAAFLAFFSSVIFFVIKNGNPKANRFLSLFCFSTAIYLARSLLLLNEYLIRPLWLNEFMDNSRFFLGPTLFFYIKKIVDADVRFKWPDAIHLAPVMVNLAVRLPFYFHQDHYQIYYLAHWLNESIAPGKIVWNYVSQAVFFASFFFYLGSVIRYNWKCKEQIVKSSILGPFYLSWFRILTFALSISWIPLVVGMILVFSGYSLRYAFYSMNLLISFVVFFCIMKIFSWPEILFMAKPLKCSKKYDTSCLTDQEADRFLDKIKYLMEQERVYLDPDLDLSALAARLSISKNDLSRIINEKAGRPFNDLINCYRIESIKTWLRKPSRTGETILALAFEAGFNSKASFNNAFKKKTGLSPLAFKKRCTDPNANTFDITCCL